VRLQRCIFCEQHLPDKDLPSLCLGTQSGDIIQFPICSSADKDSFLTAGKNVMKSIDKQIPNSVGAKTQPCFTPLLTGKASDIPPLKKKTTMHVLEKGSHHLNQSWGASNLLQKAEEPAPTNQVDEGDVQWLLLLSTLLLQLA
jgi:hypothetical protein